MSLQVWLPLNGDLNNQGLNQDVTITRVGGTTTSFNTGKIGQGLSCNGSTYWTMTPVTITATASICWWAKTNTNAKMPWVITATSYGSLNFYCSSIYTLNTGDSNNNPFKKDGNNISVLNDNNWHHFAVTFGSNICKLYIDGDYKGTATTFKSPATTSAKIVKLAGGFANAHSYDWNGMLNDFRIYDNCLTEKEVKKLSQGLILHYPLNSTLCETTTNLCQALISGGRTTIVNGTIQNTGQDADTYWFIKPKEAFINGGTYTLSCFLSGLASNDDYIRWGVGSQSSSNANHAGSWTMKNGFNSFTFVTPTGLSGSSNNLIFDDNGGSTGVRTQLFTISNIQLEQRDHATPFVDYGKTYTATTIYDCSGYKNNGTIVGSLSVAAATPIYKAATAYSGTVYSTCTSPSTEVKTVSVWVKWDSIPSGQSVIYVDQASKTGLGLMSTGILVNTNQTGNVFNKSGIVANTWYHFVIVSPNGSSNAIRQLYINGVAQTAKSNTSSWSYTLNELQLGKRSTTTDGFVGKLSDFRMYVTALDADDVAELYQLGQI